MRVMHVIAIAFAIVLAGCGMLQPKSDFSGDQIRETVKDKNGFVGCSSVIGAWGTVLTVIANLDQNSPSGKNATLTVRDGCKDIELNTDSPPKVPKPVPQVGSPTPVPRVTP